MENCKATSTPIEVRLKLSAKTDSELANQSIYRQLVGKLMSYSHKAGIEFCSQLSPDL
jgi:hypothetical protein